VNKVKEQLSKHMHTLCEQIGERHIGSEGEAKAADYIEQVFQSSGYRVYRESFDAPGWNYGDYNLEIVGTGRSLPCFPCYYSHACDATGKLLIVDPENLDDFDVKGRICFIPSKPSHEGVFDRNDIAERLDEKGAAALIVVSCLYHAVDTKTVRTPRLKRLGVMCIAGETVWEIGRNIGADFRVKIDAETFPARPSNIVARVEGDRGKKAVIGAHYDTTPGTAAASDDGSGTAVLLELARLLRDKTNGYSIDFAAFSAEEYGEKGGGLGSFEYVRQHHAELEHVSWMSTIDCVGLFFGQELAQVGRGRSWQMKDCIERTVKPYGLITTEVGPWCDSTMFYNNGIPTVSFFNTSCWSELHSTRDALDIVSMDGLTNVCKATFAVFSQLLKQF